jgi:hypothetical protein
MSGGLATATIWESTQTLPEEFQMSAITATHTPTTTPKRSFRRCYSVAHGNAYQAWGVFSGSALLALATQLRNSPVSTAFMIAGFVTVYLNCHAIAHYLAGRAVGLRFRGYAVRGTDHPAVYPPGIRQVMQAAPFYVALSTKESRNHASGRAKAIYYAAGETSTAICSIAYAAIAAAANIPGAQALLAAMIIFNAVSTIVSTIVTTRNPTGDYGKALRALRS